MIALHSAAIAHALLATALAPQTEVNTRRVALHAIGNLRVTLDLHTTKLLQLSQEERVYEELIFVIRQCITQDAFHRALGQIPLDTVDVDFLLDRHAEYINSGGEPDDRIKRFLYRVIQAEHPASARAIGRFPGWCSANFSDRLVFRYLAWLAPLETRVAAISALVDMDSHSLEHALCLLDCLALTNEPKDQLLLLHSVKKLRRFKAWTAHRISYTPLLASGNHIVVGNTLKLMGTCRVHTSRYWIHCLLLMFHWDAYVQDLARSLFGASFRHWLPIDP